MNLLLLLYAMVAGLTGFTAGPSTIARMAAVAEAGSVASIANAPDQVSVAAKAFAARISSQIVRPIASIADARRIVVASAAEPIVAAGRAAPERRRE
jgi:hypothetical protein